STTVYIANSPLASTNVTQTRPWALWIDAGDMRLDGKLVGVTGITLGSITAQPQLLYLGNAVSAPAWTTDGIVARFSANTYTDTSSSGTVAATTGIAYQTPTFAASS